MYNRSVMPEIEAREKDPNVPDYFVLHLDGNGLLDINHFDQLALANGAKLPSNPDVLAHLKYVVCGMKMYFFSADFLHIEFCRAAKLLKNSDLRAAGELYIKGNQTDVVSRIVFGESYSLMRQGYLSDGSCEQFKQNEFAPLMREHFIVRALRPDENSLTY